MKRWKILAASLACIAILFGWLILRQVRQIKKQPPTAWTEDHSADCAVVLTGAPGRVREGFDLLSQGAVRKLILSGVFPGSKFREIFPQWAYYGDVDERDVVLEKRSSTTYGNAQQALAVVEALHCRDIILVTDRIHMYRSLRTFRAIFPTDFPIYGRAIIRGSYKPSWNKLLTESIRSLFYSFWVY